MEYNGTEITIDESCDYPYVIEFIEDDDESFATLEDAIAFIEENLDTDKVRMFTIYQS
jgi:hypothetical protein